MGFFLRLGRRVRHLCEFCLGFACACGVCRLGMCMHVVLGWPVDMFVLDGQCVVAAWRSACAVWRLLLGM